ncbi:MAG: hypothetical protein J1F09_06710 [Oscillospiraceae bacterium]|nr:hypothetical protein [Oscillospiraceae bacterium]
MAFVFEKVPKEDWEFFKSMGLKDYTGKEPLYLSERTAWCADRERNAYLVEIGGRFSDEYPFYCDFWWNGTTIRLDVGKHSIGDFDTGFVFEWIINALPIPRNMQKHKDEIVNMIIDAFTVKSDWCLDENLKSIRVEFNCDNH